MNGLPMHRQRPSRAGSGPRRAARLLLLAICCRRDRGHSFGAGPLSRESGQGRLHAAGRLRTGAAVPDLLLRSGKSHRGAERRMGDRRMGGPAQSVVGRRAPAGDRRLHVAEALRPDRQGRDQAARNRAGADHGAGRGVRRGAHPRPDGHRLPAAHQSAVHQSAGQPDGAQHVRGVHIDGLGGPGLLHRRLHHEDEESASPRASSGCRTPRAAPASRKA